MYLILYIYTHFYSYRPRQLRRGPSDVRKLFEVPNRVPDEEFIQREAERNTKNNNNNVDTITANNNNNNSPTEPPKKKLPPGAVPMIPGIHL